MKILGWIIRGTLLLLFCFAIFLSNHAHAMDQPHYDVESLVYMSTDIVVAKLSGTMDNAKKTSDPPVLNIEQVWHGSLKPGAKIEGMKPFLTFFSPMESGQTMVIFLGPPAHDDFLSDVKAAPYSIVPSGIYLIDEHQHVHKCFQQDNPGPYVAEGDDPKLLTLDETYARIETSLQSIAALKPLLDKKPKSDDALALLKLLKERRAAISVDGAFNRDAIAEKATSQIELLNDPNLVLDNLPLLDDDTIEYNFIRPPSGTSDPDYTKKRVALLVHTLGDHSKSLAVRVAAGDIIARVSEYQDAGTNQPILVAPERHDEIKDFANEIVAVAKRIFEDESEHDNLRELCMTLMGLRRPETLAAAKTVYKTTHSEDLRFTIEDAFLDIDDALYLSLNAPGGPVAAIVRPMAAGGMCGRVPKGKFGFMVSYHERSDFNQAYMNELEGTNGDGTKFPYEEHFVLENEHTRARTLPEDVQQCWNGGPNGANVLFLDQNSPVPEGKYRLYYEYTRNGHPISRSRSLLLTASKGVHGLVLTIP